MARTRRPLTRSEQMSRIRGRDTAPELVVRGGLWAAGLRYRLHAKTPGGRADIVIPGARFALFVDGCFWHGCPEHYVRPRSRNEFWDAKLRENVDRDRRQTLALENAGWRVLRVWEHEISEAPTSVLERAMAAIGTVRFRPRAQWRVVRVEFLDREGQRECRHLEDLRDDRRRKTEEGARSTRKTGRIRRSRGQEGPQSP